jgi:hypothetical protein
MSVEIHLAKAHQYLRSANGAEPGEGETIFGEEATDDDLEGMHRALHRPGEMDHPVEHVKYVDPLAPTG